MFCLASREFAGNVMLVFGNKQTLVRHRLMSCFHAYAKILALLSSIIHVCFSSHWLIYGAGFIGNIMHKQNIQRRYLPSHSVLRSFECAARHQSFTLAAEELHLTQSAISRQVKELEDNVGTALFRRSGRRVLLTKAGRTLAEKLAVDLENIHQTIMRAVSAGRQGTAISMAVLPGFASRWLIPRLPEFSAQHPNIELNLSTRIKPFDLDREHFDLAIHFGTDDWPDTDMRELCTETMIAVSSPEFKKQYKICDLNKLADVPLLHMETRPVVWQQFFQQNGIEDNIILSGKYFDQFSMIIAGAVASLGAALVPTYLIERELGAGLLVQLGEPTVTTKNSYYMVTPSNRRNEDVDLLCDWMKNSVGERVGTLNIVE
jgi:LysR family glycine cleavage system transcriptional activator